MYSAYVSPTLFLCIWKFESLFHTRSSCLNLGALSSFAIKCTLLIRERIFPSSIMIRSHFVLNTTTVYHVAILRKQVPSNGVLEPATLTVVPIKYNAIQLSVAPPEICSINSHKLMRYATQLNLKCKLPKLNGLRNLFMFVHSFVRSLSLFSPDVCVCVCVFFYSLFIFPN